MVGHNEIGDGIINVIGAPPSDNMLAPVVGLQRAEAILIKFKIIVKSQTMLQSEEINKMV